MLVTDWRRGERMGGKRRERGNFERAHLEVRHGWRQRRAASVEEREVAAAGERQGRRAGRRPGEAGSGETEEGGARRARGGVMGGREGRWWRRRALRCEGRRAGRMKSRVSWFHGAVLSSTGRVAAPLDGRHSGVLDDGYLKSIAFIDSQCH